MMGLRADQLEALIDVVGEDEEYLMAMFDTDRAILILNRLADRQMSCQGLLERARHEQFGDRRLNAVAAKVREQGRFDEFITAIMEMDLEWWGLYFTPAVAAGLIGSAPELANVFAEHLHLFRDPSHPLYGVCKPDAYWLRTVRYYVAKGDFVRAWDELRKAIRGIAQKLEEDQNYLTLQREGDLQFTCAASRETVETLVRELHDAMVKARWFESVPEGTFVRPSQLEYVRSYETRLPKNGRKPLSAERRIPVAGYAEASKHFFTPDGRMMREGKMIIEIARVVRERRNERRRRKFDALLVNYERSVAST